VATSNADFRQSWKRLSDALQRIGLREVRATSLSVIFEFDERDALVSYDKYVRPTPNSPLYCSLGVIYSDFAKSFDSVCHPKLVHKSRAYRFCGDLLRILANFLQDRTQRVVLPDGASTFRSVISGIPRGSVLGPALFLVYINDIVDLFQNTNVCTKLYADDIKIYLEIACNLAGQYKQDLFLV